MGIRYDLADLINNMIELEITGASFYQERARLMDNPPVARLLLQLAEQERLHQTIYEHLRGQLAAEPMDDEEYRDYLREVIDESFNLDPEQGACCFDTRAVLEFGIRLEKDSIRFVEAFGKLTGARHREVVEQIKKQEQNHLRQLLEMRESIVNST